MAHFVIEKQAVQAEPSGSGWLLCLQWGRIEYGVAEQPPLWGYRFIWRRPSGTQQARGAARLTSRRVVEKLWRIADREGWGDFDGEDPPMPEKAAA